MKKASDAQRRMIFKLAMDKGMDHDVLRTYALNLVGKSSLKELNTLEARKIIDNLNPNKSSGSAGMITFKQRQFIEGLAADIGWVAEGSKKLDRERLNAWLYNRYKISNINWLTTHKASDAIEGLKAMNQRKKEAI